ncbi:MAG TPA: VCBS repeat-containing protein [Candidatus Acidoferrales bacterium]|nr:VCBS repeat-containing protein [Candidatus Acidoferrales bacterium]
MKFSRTTVLAALIFSFAFGSHGGTNAAGFEFTGPEIFPIDQQISLLHAADLNGDHLTDLILANNLRSKINLLYNQSGKTNLPASADSGQPLDVNQLPPGSRFRIDSIPVDEHISAMVVTDLNGDGRPDIAFYGDAKDLEVIYNQGTNGWSDPERWHIDNGRTDGNALAEGDLNGDGRTDLVLLGDNGSLYFLPQLADHTLGEPQKIPYSGTPEAVQIIDVNGDGRKDLLLVDWDSATPFRFRLQSATGQLGPEIYFKSPPIRSYCADNLEGGAQNYVVTIAQNSGRAEVSRFLRKPAEPLSGAFRQGQFQILPLTKTDAAQRGMLWADVNGDGRPDLLVAQPDSGQISVYLQQPDGSLAEPQTFPTLAGVSQLAAADWNKDGKSEIFLLSQTENAVGVTQFDKNGRLPFPSLLPIDGKPLVMAVGSLRPGAKPSLAMIVDQNGQRYLVIRSADGKIRTQKLSESFTSNPVTMAIADVNQDGLPDLVVLIPYEKVKILLQKPDGDFDEENVDPPGGAMDRPWLTSVDVDGDGKPELLLPQKNFVRAVVLEKETETVGSTNRSEWVFRVKDQINGSWSDSHIVGAATLPNGRNAIPSVFLLDAEHGCLTLCERNPAGVWQVKRNVDLPVSDFNSLQSVALGGPDMHSIAFMGQNAAAWMPLGGDVWSLDALDGYDTPIKDGYLNDVSAGDLNNNGHKELIFLETAKNYLDIVNFNSQHKLVPAVRWQVFEQHTFRGATDALPEPREVVVANVTGGKKNDLIVVVHDRILVYPQE